MRTAGIIISPDAGDGSPRKFSSFLEDPLDFRDEFKTGFSDSNTRLFMRQQCLRSNLKSKTIRTGVDLLEIVYPFTFAFQINNEDSLGIYYVRCGPLSTFLALIPTFQPPYEEADGTAGRLDNGNLARISHFPKSRGGDRACIRVHIALTPEPELISTKPRDVLGGDTEAWSYPRSGSLFG